MIRVDPCKSVASSCPCNILISDMTTRKPSLVLFLVLALALVPCHAQLKTRNVVLIVCDGIRWQEVFSGADPTLLNEKDGGIQTDEKKLRAQYWRDNIEERRKALFPFLWGVVAKQGQILGNQNKGSVARLTNGKAFSYPGYNEILTGHADPRIDSNSYGPNPNVTVFEWLNQMPEFQGKVAAYATWDAFADIFNEKRSHLIMQVGWDPPATKNPAPQEKMLAELYRSTTRYEESAVYDSFLQAALLDHLRNSQPRVLFVGFGETDTWAHSGRYDLLLESAHHCDHFVQQLWETMQSMPQYRDQTTFIVTTDHGRGSGLQEWKDHGAETKGAENIWIAIIGPDTAALGERTKTGEATQAQIAATVAAFLGKDYPHAVPVAAPPLSEVLRGSER